MKSFLAAAVAALALFIPNLGMSQTSELAASSSAPVEIASFSTIVTEIAQAVGGADVHVNALVKPNVDPHAFEPSPGDLIAVGKAQLILASGKHLENYAAKLREAAGRDATLVAVGDAFPSLKRKDEDHGGAVIEDPHWWNNIGNVELATDVVRDALVKLRPAQKAEFEANAAAYRAKLEALEKWAKTKLAELPRDQRKLVTSHDAFQYFAKEFGFSVYPVQGVSTQDEPSSRNVAELIATIKAQKVKAVFFESIENPKVLQEILRDTGAKVGGDLYADGLGLGEASTYEGMIRHNITTIVDALK